MQTVLIALGIWFATSIVFGFLLAHVLGRLRRHELTLTELIEREVWSTRPVHHARSIGSDDAVEEPARSRRARIAAGE